MASQSSGRTPISSVTFPSCDGVYQKKIIIIIILIIVRKNLEKTPAENTLKKKEPSIFHKKPKTVFGYSTK